MCYDIQTKLEAQLKRARRMNQKEVIRDLETTLEPYLAQWYHVSGFEHPSLLIYTNETPTLPSPATWGLIREWTKNREQANKLRRKTINARGESIFDKASFRYAAIHKHCLITVNGFYEHHHRAKKTFPYYIQQKDGNPMTIAGLCSDWFDQETEKTQRTFCIVTCKANLLLSKIHNNPKLSEARMPLILSDEKADEWLLPIDNLNAKKYIQNKVHPSSKKLISHTVRPLRGKLAIGNLPDASKVYLYDELNELF
ncbi:hypothetical protein BZG02_14620 [Labilibaculum filiforme]|uniref:Abasic site processing protein n=1 Tax=Labilibaculum filiforme TaxID=1940526 RepID=A0A2N3HUV8_9BACT|nr:SOS response-associated peptidase family protein [Labilibaculum filiforme]PKQ61856.1 hypothetical protein BZG02_14620 [Labilibaculum filiforme]